MDKNAIKKYAVWARRELIARVSQKAAQYEITENKITPAESDTVGGYVLSATEKKQRQALIAKIKKAGFKEVVEEVAYTWFNRFTALRFMEVNDYLPSKVRVFTNVSGEFKPQILTEAINLDITGLNINKVYELKNSNKTEELYKYLLITQCNALNTILPEMFEKIEDYTELLLPDYLLRSGSVIEQMVTGIPEEDWKDQVQVIGWLYQYYNSEPKDQVFADMKKNIKVSKENIAAATQIFTPDWIVRYMVENSLGRLWIEGHADTSIKTQWKYYLEEAEQTPEVQTQLAEIRKSRKQLTPEEVRFIDPCMGSGHILVYAFDVLMQIYLSYGYSECDAAQSIVLYNLWGLDLDKRAYQLAYFAVMMKGRFFDRNFLNKGIKPNLSHFQDLPTPNYSLLEEPVRSFVQQFENADTYGALISVEMNTKEQDALAKNEGTLELTSGHIEHLIKLASILAQKYDVVCTNPPYMGTSNMVKGLSDYLKNKYPDSKSDMFSAFVERAFALTKHCGFTSMITMESWMFLSSFEKLRLKINTNKTIINMVHMPYLGKGGTSLGINFGTTAFIMAMDRIHNYNAQYEYIVYYETNDEGVPFEFPTINERWKITKQENFSKIPGSPIAYWISEHLINIFEQCPKLNDVGITRLGMTTGENAKFVRFWYEVDIENCEFNATSQEELNKTRAYYVPYNKGGNYRKWYGNNDFVLFWKNCGYDIKHFTDTNGRIRSTVPNTEYYYLPCASWSKISSGKIAFRFKNNSIFDVAGACYFAKKYDLSYMLGFLNSNVVDVIIGVLSSTLNYEGGQIASLPIKYNEKKSGRVIKLVEDNKAICKYDWDSFETSWDFKRHPLISIIAKNRLLFDDISAISLAECYICWENECKDLFNQLKANEEEINRIFIDIYGLQDEITPEVEDNYVTVRKADLQRDIRSFISYAVGCMFGRYSLDVEGLVYAGGKWDALKYKIFTADSDAIIPICDDEYFDDDIVGRFAKFVETIYGKESLEDNLNFIAKALGGKGTSREVIRKYFLNDFYADHVKIYQKRPIYWLFDSGKNNGFKCLVYMHRYHPDTIARIRTDYVHEQQARYRTAIAALEQRINAATTAERVKLNKKLETLKAQADEIQKYEEKIHHLADQMIAIDLDDGVKVNYAKFQDVLAKIK